MQIRILEGNFAVCQIKSVEEVDFSSDCTFLSKTQDEISLVCREENVPKNSIKIDSGWNGFLIVGTLEFSQIGIISKISTALAEEKIPVFVVSTYNTDYVFVKSKNFTRTLEIMQKVGYLIITDNHT